MPETLPDLPPCCTLPPASAPIEHAGYAAYNAGGERETAGLTYQGKPCPEWDGLTPNVREKWKAARQEMARRIIAEFANLTNFGEGRPAELATHVARLQALVKRLTED